LVLFTAFILIAGVKNQWRCAAMAEQFDVRSAQPAPFVPVQEKGDLLNTVRRALHVLDLIAAHPAGLSAREISRALHVNISTCYHILNTLVAAGYLDRDQRTLCYILGPQIPFLNNAFVQGLAQQVALDPLAQENLAEHPLTISATRMRHLHAILHRLTEQTQEPSYLACWYYEEVMIQAIVEAPKAPKISGLYVGYRGQAHSLALGKVLLAYSDPAFVERYLSLHPLTSQGPHTIVHSAQFMEELNSIVRQGYSIDREEFSDNTCCLAAPIFAPRGQVVAALSISTSTETLSRRADWLIAQVTRSANHARAELRLSSCNQYDDET
jgi:DNA-binding IclR family transcriptional regulator